MPPAESRLDPTTDVAPPTLGSALGALPYPGRGLAVVGTRTGVAAAYFLTGRSAASRNRALEATPEGGVVVRDLSSGPDDPLRHYVALVRTSDAVVIGNGEQVAEVATDLERGTHVWDALSRHDHEPDPPINTPRITLVAEPDGSTVHLAISRHSDLDRDASDVLVGRFRSLPPGEGLLLVTYRGSIEEPRGATGWVEVTSEAGDAEALLAEVSTALSAELAVAALAIELGNAAGEPAIWHAPVPHESSRGADR